MRLFSFDGSAFSVLTTEDLGDRVITHSVFSGKTLVLVDRRSVATKWEVGQSLVMEQEVALEGQVSQVCLVRQSLLVARWNSPQIESRPLSDLD